MSTVETRNITKLFGDVLAVDRIDLAAKEGEFLVLLGPSGCGKSTLMRMIAGIEDPTSGDVVIDDRIVTDLPPRARNVAMVFQNYALYPHLSVYRNIAFPLSTQGVRRAAIRERVNWAAKMFKIEHLLGRKPRQLSGGERQRVALARALVREPVVFLLDEPLSNLDAKLRHTARDEIQQFQRRIGTTTIYVTHDQVEAMALGDRIAVLNGGRVCQLGTPDEVYHHPADTFVATFIGSPPMNLVDTDSVTLGFRPEEFLPREVFTGEGETMDLPFRVTRIENLGADRLLYGMLEGAHSEAKVVAELPSMVTTTIEPGECYNFLVKQASVRHFDRETGRRLDGAP
jgi:multiple sugar transport system ATP-binding protein